MVNTIMKDLIPVCISQPPFGQHGVNATTDVGQMKRAQPTGYGLRTPLSYF
jgi:hypothetical protein